jgi:hypothetical protein
MLMLGFAKKEREPCFKFNQYIYIYKEFDYGATRSADGFGAIDHFSIFKVQS